MSRMNRALSGVVCASSLVVGLLAATPRAHACGCFAPPDPSVPIVQAGERILFAMENGVVTAHIQIQYAGNAAEFGWILPLPSIPTLELGTDELFSTLITTTQPKYRMQQRFEGSCFQNRAAGAGGPTSAGSPNAGPPSESDSSSDGYTPLVFQDSIGPYDYAVLRADRKDEMLAWLAENRYFVPVGTDDVVGPYIRPGAYFLALKLRSGKSAGDLQPVVLRYPSDLPMIPIILTSVAAQPNMGVQVWLLGQARAIPRNFFHTVINDALIDWQRAGRNYNDVIIRAVGSAPERHAFVTEFAGASTVMRNQLDRPGRFGAIADLARQPDAVSFVEYLQSYGFTFTSQLIAILTQYFPVPAGLAEAGINAASWLQNLAYFTSPDYQRRNPEQFDGWPGLNYAPHAIAGEIEDRVVKPTLAAGALFQKFPYLTRLYTTLSPEDMTVDPVFSFNPTLSPYSNEHNATMTYYCTGDGRPLSAVRARLVTEQGYVIDYPAGTGQFSGVPPTVAATPPATRLEVLREEGPPDVIVDNSALIRGGFAPRGCSTVSGDSLALPAVLLLLASALLVARRRKRGSVPSHHGMD